MCEVTRQVVLTAEQAEQLAGDIRSATSYGQRLLSPDQAERAFNWADVLSGRRWRPDGWGDSPTGRGACECGHVPARHRVGDDDGGPGPCRDCDCIVYEEAPAEPVRCVGCGRVRRPDGPLCPRCGSELSEAVDECDVAEGEWVEAY